MPGGREQAARPGSLDIRAVVKDTGASRGAGLRLDQWFSDAGDSDAHGGERAGYSILSPEHYYVGTPHDILAAISASQERLGYEELIFWAQPPGMPAERASASLELIARHVLPALREPAALNVSGGQQVL